MFKVNINSRDDNALANTVNEELKNVSDWLKASKLSLKIKKDPITNLQSKKQKKLRNKLISS